MREGEESLFLFKWWHCFGELGAPPLIPEKSDMIYKIKLLKLIPMIDSIRAEEPKSIKERISSAIQLKEQGNRHFKDKSYELAKKSFNLALKELTITTSSFTEEELPKVNELKISLEMNLALTYNNLKLYDKAIPRCSLILQQQPEHLKALLNRGNAYMLSGELEKAKEDFDLGKKIDSKTGGNESRYIDKIFAQLREKEKEFKLLQNQMYARMFAEKN
eukprot:TRINITY_DN16921_c0_g1_i1.p1 TRINITY_DN16921_c0_g1~~TRINITY_DN16921_c0_g1_i1.p1  ORF type:complete len:219 (+),score=37.38 TRINITY_DN16921_c0_g1_i1:576-1232(+)